MWPASCVSRSKLILLMSSSENHSRSTLIEIPATIEMSSSEVCYRCGPESRQQIQSGNKILFADSFFQTKKCPYSLPAYLRLRKHLQETNVRVTDRKPLSRGTTRPSRSPSAAGQA